MSFWKKSLLFLFVFLLIVVGLLYWRKSWVASIKAKDYVALETEILLPDTDGKGFSDKVKKDIDDNFSDDQIRKAFYKVAKIERDLARSKTKDDFFKNSIKSSKAYDCVLFLQYFYKKQYFKDKNPSISLNIIHDNEDMKNFIKFLDKYRFGSAEFDNMMTDLTNNSQINIKTKYEDVCSE